MTYQVVATHRTGSTFLNSYCINDNDGLGFAELFLNKSYTGLSFLDNATIKEKFQFLEYYKKKDIHFSIKIFPKKIIDQGYEDILYNYLKGYKILTIYRNPFDAFLSMEYQKATGWEFPHRKTSSNIPKPYFDIDINVITDFINKWNADYKFINKLNIEKTFNYNELTVRNLQKFFSTSYKPDIIPMNINYRMFVNNLKEVEETFFKEMKCHIS